MDKGNVVVISGISVVLLIIGIFWICLPDPGIEIEKEDLNILENENMNQSINLEVEEDMGSVEVKDEVKKTNLVDKERNKAFKSKYPRPSSGELEGMSKGEQMKSAILTWSGAIKAKDRAQIQYLNRYFLSEREMALPELKRLAEESDNERVRAISLRVLGQMKQKTLESFFINRLAQDKSRFVQENCAWALGELKSQAAIPILQKLQRETQYENVNLAATSALDIIQK